METIIADGVIICLAYPPVNGNADFFSQLVSQRSLQISIIREIISNVGSKPNIHKKKVATITHFCIG